jgi:hypothetical protein
MTKRILMLLVGAVLALAALPAVVAQDAPANDKAKSKNLAVPTGLIGLSAEGVQYPTRFFPWLSSSGSSGSPPLDNLG